MQEIMGNSFREGALRVPIIRQAFDQALAEINEYHRQALLTYWDLETEQPRMNIEELAKVLRVSANAAEHWVRRGQISIFRRICCIQDPEFKNAIRQFKGHLQ